MTAPAAAFLVDYIEPAFVDLTPEGEVARQSPEVITFIPAEESLTDKAQIAVAYEISGTTIVYDLDAPTSVGALQGRGHVSPLAGEAVKVPGIVTAVDSNGFYLQDPVGDGDDRTSDAVFVFTRSAPEVAVGDRVLEDGTVSEFTPGSASTRNLSTTQISEVTEIKVLASGQPLPAPVEIGGDGRVPPSETIDDDAFTSFDASEDGIDFFESLEGMRVTAKDAVAVAGTNRFGEIFTVVDMGAGATGLSERGTLNLSPDDFNPERVQIQRDSGVLDFALPEVAVGAGLGDVTGVGGYGFGNFEIIVTEDFSGQVVTSELEPETSAIAGGTDTFTIATYNVLNLDPNDADGDTDVADGRFGLLGEHIASNLGAPAVVALQEVQDNSGSDDDGTVAADQTLQTLVDAIAAADGPDYAFIDNTFITDGLSGGQPGGNIRTAFLYDPGRVELVEGSVQTIGDQDAGEPFAGARLPLVATFAFDGTEITATNNHLSSKGGSAPILGLEQPSERRQEDVDVNGSLDERRVQAAAVKAFADGLLEEDPDADVVILGDLNEFEFVSPVLGLAGEGFANLTDEIAEDERYTFIFQGNSQSLDHILARRARPSPRWRRSISSTSTPSSLRPPPGPRITTRCSRASRWATTR